MIKKLLTVLLLVVLSQATFVVHAGMHFPGTANVDHGTFNGIAEVEGFGTTDYATVSLNLVSSGGLTALCINPAGNIAPGQKILNINITQTSPNLPVDRQGNASFSFTVPLLPSTKDAGCPNGKWSVFGLKGTLFATYYAYDYSSVNVLKAKASLGFQCNIDESVNTHTTCAQIFETAENVK